MHSLGHKSDCWEFEANVLALLAEAERRYEIFACRAMEVGEAALEDFFAELAMFANMELEDAGACGYVAAPPSLAPEIEALRQRVDGNASACWLGRDGVGDLRILLGLSIECCSFARLYFSRVMVTATDSATRRAAQAYAREELAVQEALERWMMRLVV